MDAVAGTNILLLMQSKQIKRHWDRTPADVLETNLLCMHWRFGIICFEML